MFYYMYQITNKVNGKVYIGVHKTGDMNDGYMGSGKVIRSAIKKYGIGNFEKVILEFFSTPEAMYAREKEVVDEEFLLREDVYNLRRGGHGGFDFVNVNCLNYGGKAGNSRGGMKGGKVAGKITGPLTGAKNLERARELYPNGAFFGKSHSIETLNKMSASQQGKHTGERNSQFGTMWITDGIRNLKIKKTDDIPSNWKRGRIISNQI